MSTTSYSNDDDPLHATCNMILTYCPITLIAIMISHSLLVQWLMIFVILNPRSIFCHHFTLTLTLIYLLVLVLINLRGIYCHPHQPDITV